MGTSDQILATMEVLDRIHRLPDTVALTTSEAAIFLRSSVSALETMRATGTGPLYIQAGTKGVAGANQKCLYEKADLLAWQRSNKISSTMEAAVRKGQLFASVFDLAQTEAFWLDDKGRVVGMVEAAPIATVIDRLGTFEIAWLPVLDGAAREWADLSEHQSLADQVNAVLSRERQRVAAGVEATDIAGLMNE